MNADSAFRMGSTHAVCQDYAVAGACASASSADGAEALCHPYVILSDGCSSSPDTDTGARLLVKAAERLLRKSGGPNADGLAGLHAEAAHLALSWAELLGLKPQAVDATLLTAHIHGGKLIVGCSGDGVVCLQTTEGALDVYAVSYPAGFPVYPAYAHQPARLRALADARRERKEVMRFSAASARERLRRESVSDSGALTEVFAISAARYRFAALFSDGIQSFSHSGRAEAIPLESVLPELVSFKNTRGGFVNRRMNGFLKVCQQKGWRHGDDLSLAALHLGG